MLACTLAQTKYLTISAFILNALILSLHTMFITTLLILLFFTTIAMAISALLHPEYYTIKITTFYFTVSLLLHFTDTEGTDCILLYLLSPWFRVLHFTFQVWYCNVPTVWYCNVPTVSLCLLSCCNSYHVVSPLETLPAGDLNGGVVYFQSVLSLEEPSCICLCFWKETNQEK